MSYNFRLSFLVTMATILLSGYLSHTSARHTDASSRLHYGRINKRDVVPRQTLGTGGLALQCKLHPRNCPGGYMSKKGYTLLERLGAYRPSLESKVSSEAETTDNQDFLSSLDNVDSTQRRVSSEEIFRRVLDLLASVKQTYEKPKTW